MRSNSSGSSGAGGGIGFLSALQLIFITLKVINKIDWPWPVVLIPTWIGIGITVIVIFIITSPLLIVLYKDRKARRKDKNE